MPCYRGVVTDVQVFEYQGKADDRQAFADYLADLLDVTGEFESIHQTTEIKEVPCR